MDKIFEIELPQLPAAGNFGQAGKAQQAIALSALASMARTTWVSLANKRMPGNGQRYLDYIQSIQEPEILPGMAIVALVGKEAHDIEFGRASYDLRDVLLGPKVPVKARGDSGKGKYRSKQGQYYRFIPFRHTNKESAGVLGAPVGSQHVGAMGAVQAKELGKFIWKNAQQLKASIEGPDRKTQWGERLISGLAPKLKPHHTTSIYSGMYRVVKQYEKKSDPKYVTFRTISTSRRVGWIMPATTGVHIMAALKGHMVANAPGYITSIINAPSSGGVQPEPPT